MLPYFQYQPLKIWKGSFQNHICQSADIFPFKSVKVSSIVQTMLSLSFSEKSSAHPLRHVRALGQLQQEQHCAKEKPHYALVKVNPVKRKGNIELQEVFRCISIETQRKHLGSQHNPGIIVKTDSGPEMQHHLAKKHHHHQQVPVFAIPRQQFVS